MICLALLTFANTVRSCFTSECLLEVVTDVSTASVLFLGTEKVRFSRRFSLLRSRLTRVSAFHSSLMKPSTRHTSLATRDLQMPTLRWRRRTTISTFRPPLSQELWLDTRNSSLHLSLNPHVPNEN